MAETASTQETVPADGPSNSMSKFDFLRQDYDNKLAAMKSDYENKILAIRTIFDMSKEADKSALALALHTMDKRLEGMNEFRDSLNDQTKRMMTRDESTLIITALAEKVDKQSRPNIAAWLAVGGVVVAMFGALWGGIVLLVNNGIATQTATLTAVQTADVNRDQAVVRMQAALDELRERSVAGSQADQSSRDDRAQLNGRMRRVEDATADNNSERKAWEAGTSKKLIEFDGDFKAVGNAFATAKDTEDRWLSIIYEHVFPGQRMPPENFRPTLYNASPSPVVGVVP